MVEWKAFFKNPPIFIIDEATNQKSFFYTEDKKMSLKKFTAIVAGLLVSSFLFAQKYNICIASFSKFENASKYVRELTLQGYSTTIEPTVVKEKIYYRILLAETFDSLQKAKQRKAEFSRDTGKKDSWIFNADLTKKTLPAAAVSEARKEFEGEGGTGKSVRLAKNSSKSEAAAEAAVSSSSSIEQPKTEETEFIPSKKTMTVTKATEEEIFESKADKGIPAVEKSVSVIGLLPSASASITLEIPEIEVKELEEFTPQTIEEKKDTVQKPVQTVKYEIASTIQESVVDTLNGKEISFDEKQIPSTITESVKELIELFPMNGNFKIERISFFDLENIRDGALNTDTNVLGQVELPFEFSVQDERLSAASLGKYEDRDFGEKMTVMMLNGEAGMFDSVLDGLEDPTGENLQVEFKIDGEEFECTMVRVSADSEKHQLFGTNEDGSVFIAVQAEEFSKTWLNRFVVGQISSQESIFKNHAAKKSLLSLPYEDAKIDRRFLKFDLEKSGETVIREEGFKNAEHWNATAEFDQEDTVLKIVFYDID